MIFWATGHGPHGRVATLGKKLARHYERARSSACSLTFLAPAAGSLNGVCDAGPAFGAHRTGRNLFVRWAVSTALLKRDYDGAFSHLFADIPIEEKPMTPNVTRPPASRPKPAGAQTKEPAWKPATAEQLRRFEAGLKIADLCRQSGLPREEFKELLARAIKGTVSLAQAQRYLHDRALVRSIERLAAEQRKRRPL